MPTIIPLRKRTDGYGECWYCGNVDVNINLYRTETRDGPLTFACCRRKRCNDARRDGSIDPLSDDE